MKVFSETQMTQAKENEDYVNHFNFLLIFVLWASLSSRILIFQKLPIVVKASKTSWCE